jgi:SAM-dependent methyltransferase
MSRIGDLYDSVYAKICGKGTRINIFHYQYLSTYQLHADLKDVLGTVSAENVLDLGCGNKPYKDFFFSYKNYIGADIYSGRDVDVILDDSTKLPFENEIFDFVLSTQVFEHVEDLTLLSEVHRVLKKDGVFLISVPFLYHIHDRHDYRRFTSLGLHNTLSKYGFTDIQIRKEGGIGSTLSILFLSFIESKLNQNRVTRMIKGVMLPFWISFSFLVNILGLLLDKVDQTGNYYNNLLAVVKKS